MTYPPFSFTYRSPCMKRHRVIVNVRAGTVVPISTDVIEVEPGRLYARTYDDCLRPMDTDEARADGEYVASGWHESLADAYAQAADELNRQAAAIHSLRLICRAGGEVVHV